MPSNVNPALIRRARLLATWAALAAARRFGLIRPARALNQFATHIPVLLGLARIIPVRRVLELGCGNYSTFTFLDRRAFPHLIELESLETDAAWAGQIAEKYRCDPRLRLRLVKDPLESTLEQLPLGSYDLLLVDHSDKYEVRAATISFLAKRAPGQVLVVLHDYEIPLYRRAARGFRHKFEFTAFTPSTCAAGGHFLARCAALRLLDRTVKNHARTLEPGHTTAWMDLLDAALGSAMQPPGRDLVCACSSSPR